MTTISNNEDAAKGFLSFKPLVDILKEMMAKKLAGAERLYRGLIADAEARPELMMPIHDYNVLKTDPELIEALISTIFPPSVTSSQNVYVVTCPFCTDVVYASPKFESQFLKDEKGKNILTHLQANPELQDATTALAYDLVLKTFYSHKVSEIASSVHAVKDGDGITRYFEVVFNARFVQVSLSDKSFKLPEKYKINQPFTTDDLKADLPLGKFTFEGFIVSEIYDVTQTQVISEIKTALLKNNSFSDSSIYEELQQHVQSIVGLRQIQTGITTFFKTNGFNLDTQAGCVNSLLFQSENAVEKSEQVFKEFHDEFAMSTEPVLYNMMDDETIKSHPLLKYYREMGAKNVLLCPLKKENNVLVGLLEVVSFIPGQLQPFHMSSLQPAVPFFEIALEKAEENLEVQIDKTIKEHFTAIQPGVEWKFTEAAFTYLQNRQSSELAKMPSITFQNVYPLYSSIDVRNSSTQRVESIQLDLLKQLKMANKVLALAKRNAEYPLVKETQYRVKRFIKAISDELLSEEEVTVTQFLQNDVKEVFLNLQHTRPELKQEIDEYFQTLDPQRNLIYFHRKNYEESITRLNDVLDRFVDNQQKEAQQIYPHYFERYVTDGIEFNIYVGQSLAPQHPFNEMQIRNLKLWQFTLLVKAAKISTSMAKRLALPLQTTQLILAHSIPLSISFRPKERKFDVDGAYNIRYEIVKKRIDKVHLKNSDERLTQPGTVAIVYSQQSELDEYLAFMEYLQSENMVGNNVEQLELEDTQGINGLKALRVNILLEDEAADEEEKKGESVTKPKKTKEEQPA